MRLKTHQKPLESWKIYLLRRNCANCHLLVRYVAVKSGQPVICLACLLKHLYRTYKPPLTP